MCGNVSDADVIAGAAGLEELDKFLLMPGTVNRRYTVEEYKKIAAAKKTEINKRLQDIPGRIDEAQRAIPEKTFSLTELDAKLKALDIKREQLTNQKASALAGDTAASDARKRTAEAEAALAEARTAYLSKIGTINQSTQETIGEVQKKLLAVQAEYDETEIVIDRLVREAARIELCREELLKQYAEVQAEVWDEGQAICPTCHRELPSEEVQRMREAFNIKRSERLQEINARGQKEANKTTIERLGAQAAAERAKAIELDAACKQYRQELKRRIQELEAQEKDLSAQYEELEQGIYLCDQFIKAKVRMLTDLINGKFRSVQFRLFVEQVNGGVKDDCEVLVPNDAGTLVPFRDANNAARINAGLEIIEALSEHWGISMPVFVDNAESVTHLLDTTMQTIRLVVSEPDSKLRLVLDR